MRISYDNDTPYCDPSDVARFFKKENPFEHANLSKADVEEMILEWSEEFDKDTHHSWRENQVLDEYHDFSGYYRWWSGRPISLTFNNVHSPLDDTKGDKLEIWEGNGWKDYVSDAQYTEGRDEDYWVEDGKLYIYRRFWLTGHPRIRVSYRYGETEVHKSVQRAVAKRVAAELMQSDQFSNLVPGGGDSMSPVEAAQAWIDDYERTVRRNKVIPDVDGYI